MNFFNGVFRICATHLVIFLIGYSAGKTMYQNGCESSQASRSKHLTVTLSRGNQLRSRAHTSKVSLITSGGSCRWNKYPLKLYEDNAIQQITFPLTRLGQEQNLIERLQKFDDLVVVDHRRQSLPLCRKGGEIKYGVKYF